MKLAPLLASTHAVILGFCLCQAPVAAAAMDEFEVKARILCVIGNYVSWPQPGEHEVKRPFVVGVVGDSPISHALDLVAKGRTFHNRELKVVYLPHFTESAAGACDLLFLCASEGRILPKIVAYCKGKPIFTIADTAGFAQGGVMLNLLVRSDSLALEVNLKAAREAGFAISGAFLSLPKDKAKIVESP